MTKSVFYLAHATARQRAQDAIRNAPDGWKVTVEEPSRTLAENALLHALIGEIAETTPWAGKLRDLETWKRLLVAAWCRAKGEHMEMLPALDGHGVDIVPARTSKLSKAECADLITYIQAWQAERETV